jgi:hypothetical protein
VQGTGVQTGARVGVGVGVLVGVGGTQTPVEVLQVFGAWQVGRADKVQDSVTFTVVPSQFF